MDGILPRRPAGRPGRVGPGERITKAHYEALSDFRHTLRVFLGFSQRAAREAGLTPRQHQALLAIKGFPGKDEPTIREFADRLLLRHHSAVELIGRLVRLGLVERRVDPEDRRRVLVSPTAKAEALLGRLSATHLDEIRHLHQSLGALLERIGKA